MKAGDEPRRVAEFTEVSSFQDLQGPLVLPGVYLASGQPAAQYLLCRVRWRLWGSKDTRDPLPRIGTVAEHDPYQEGGDRHPKDGEKPTHHSRLFSGGAVPGCLFVLHVSTRPVRARPARVLSTRLCACPPRAGRRLGFPLGPELLRAPPRPASPASPPPARCSGRSPSPRGRR